jgi:Pectate lyase superfamily protein/Right handed beta helix region
MGGLMPRLPIIGADDGQWGNILNKFLEVSHLPNGMTKGIIPVSNVKDFGALGDGITDDTQRVQLALDSVQHSGGGTVFFPVGIYRITVPLVIASSNTVIRGAGNGSVIKSSNPTDAVIKIGHPSDMNQCSNSQILDLTIDRSVEAEFTSSGILVERARFVRIAGVNIHNQGQGIGVGVPGEKGIPTQFVYIDQVFMTGGHFPDACINFNSGADYAVSRSFLGPSNRGIVMAGQSNGIFILQTTIISGDAFNYGIVSEGTGFARYMIGVNVENALKQQILIGGDAGNKRVVIADSWIGAGDDHGPSRAGILIQSGIENVLVANCRIGDQWAFGIENQGSSVKIEGNLIENNLPGGILLNGGTNILVQNNIVRGPGTGICVRGALDYYIVSHNMVHESGAEGLVDEGAGTHKVVDSNL